MAHNCPTCGQSCYCNGDIDDIFGCDLEAEENCCCCDGYEHDADGYDDDDCEWGDYDAEAAAKAEGGER